MVAGIQSKNIKNKSVNMENKSQILFSGCSSGSISIEEKILEIIGNTERELNIAMYRFLNENILNAIEERVEDGVKLNMVLDTSISSTDEYADYFFERIAHPLKELKENYPDRVKIVFMKDDTVMHHKLLLSDRKILITGSYNMTRSAEEKNMENILIYASEEDDKVISDALVAFFSMMGEMFKPEPLRIDTISIRKGVFINNVFNEISRITHSDIFIIRGMSLSFWVYGKGIHHIEIRNRNGQTMTTDYHFLYDTNADDSLRIKIIGLDGSCIVKNYTVKILPWKYPYTESFKNYMNERFNLLTQKLKYSGLL